MRSWLLLGFISFLLHYELAQAGACDQTFDKSLKLPTVLLSDAMDQPYSFFASNEENYYLSDLLVPNITNPVKSAGMANQKVYVLSLASTTDRWGRKPATLLDQQLRDLTGRLIESGIAMVKPQLRAFNCLKSLIYIEQIARDKKVGLWSDKTLISDANSIRYEQIGHFGIVEAKLISIGQTRSKTYLNFGERWTEDLTGIIQKGKLAEFSQFGHDLSAMQGKRVRIRGVVQLNHGPLIELRHPAQLELMN